MLPEFFIKNYKYTFPNKTYEIPLDYYTLLENILNDNIQISCRIYPESHYIIFDNYFNNEYFVKLFDNYQYTLMNTLKYIFN